jgi:hypothetical protein
LAKGFKGILNKLPVLGIRSFIYEFFCGRMKAGPKTQKVSGNNKTASPVNRELLDKIYHIFLKRKLQKKK